MVHAPLADFVCLHLRTQASLHTVEELFFHGQNILRYYEYLMCTVQVGPQCVLYCTSTSYLEVPQYAAMEVLEGKIGGGVPNHL